MAKYIQNIHKLYIFSIFSTELQDFMLYFCVFTGFENVVSMIKRDRSSRTCTDTKHWTRHLKQSHSTTSHRHSPMVWVPFPQVAKLRTCLNMTLAVEQDIKPQVWLQIDHGLCVPPRFVTSPTHYWWKTCCLTAWTAISTRRTKWCHTCGNSATPQKTSSPSCSGSAKPTTCRSS